MTKPECDDDQCKCAPLDESHCEVIFMRETIEEQDQKIVDLEVVIQDKDKLIKSLIVDSHDRFLRLLYFRSLNTSEKGKAGEQRVKEIIKTALNPQFRVISVRTRPGQMDLHIMIPERGFVAVEVKLHQDAVQTDEVVRFIKNATTLSGDSDNVLMGAILVSLTSTISGYSSSPVVYKKCSTSGVRLCMVNSLEFTEDPGSKFSESFSRIFGDSREIGVKANWSEPTIETHDVATIQGPIGPLIERIHRGVPVITRATPTGEEIAYASNGTTMIRCANGVALPTDIPEEYRGIFNVTKPWGPASLEIARLIISVCEIDAEHSVSRGELIKVLTKKGLAIQADRNIRQHISVIVHASNIETSRDDKRRRIIRGMKFRTTE